MKLSSRWIALALLAGACGRSFPSVTASNNHGPPPALSADPGAVQVAVDQAGSALLRGGYPPYTLVSRGTGSGSGCSGALSPDGGEFVFSACLSPFLQQTFVITDSDGGSCSIPVAVGAPLEASVAEVQVSSYGCKEIPVVITGGEPPYALLLTDGGALPSCDAGGLSQTNNVTTFQFQAPDFVDGGANTYALEILDQVELAKEPSPNLANVVSFSLTVALPPASVVIVPPLTANPAALLLAVDEPGSAALSGGFPPYVLLSAPDAGCPAYIDDAGSLVVPGCLNPGYQSSFIVGDLSSADGGGTITVPIAIGSALEANIPNNLSAPGCSTVQVTVSGGLPQYHLVVDDDGGAGVCDGGPPWNLVQSGLTTSAFQVPPFDPAHSGPYSARLMDQVEYGRLVDGGAVTPRNVISFQVTVQDPFQQALRASPPSISVAVDQTSFVAITGGTPPYALSQSDAGACLATLVLEPDAGSEVAFGPCRTPFFSTDLGVQDRAGAQIAIPVSVGQAFQSDLAGASLAYPECHPVVASVTGGAPPYHLLQVGGSDLPPCLGADGGVVSGGGQELTTFTVLTPTYGESASNVYALELMDNVEFQKLQTGGTLDVDNVCFFTLTVDAPVPPPQPVNTPITYSVAPLGSTILGRAFPGRTMSFALAYDGNSSGGTLDTTAASYTAGSNANTVDHLIATDLSEDAGPFDVWVQVGSPSVTPPFFGGSLLRSGDLNGDGVDDLIEVGQGGSQTAALGVILGSATALSTQPTLYVPSSQLRNLQLADVNGDGLQDVVAVNQQPNNNNQVSCGYMTPTGCLDDGETDFATTAGNCSVQNGQIVGCTATLFDGAGNGFASVSGYSDGGAWILPAPTGGTSVPVIVCTPDVSLMNPTATNCSANCLPFGFVDGGEGHFCTSSWSCGLGGCAPGASQAFCNTFSPDGGTHNADCGIREYTPSGDDPLIQLCDPGTGGVYTCGPFTCIPTVFGGFDCGPRDCLPDGHGNTFCSRSGCTYPMQGYTAQCNQFGGPGSASFCGSCQPPSGSTTTAYTSQPGGGFVSVGAIPGAGQSLVADLGGGLLVEPAGYRVRGNSESGVTTFAEASGPLYQLNQGNGNNPEAVLVARQADGGLWLTVEVTSEGNSNQFLVEWITATEPVQFGSTLISGTNNGNSALVPVALVDFTGNQGQSVIIADTQSTGVALSVFDPPGAGCPTIGGFVTDGGTTQVWPLNDGGALLISLLPDGGTDLIDRPINLNVPGPFPLGGTPPLDDVLGLPATRGVALGFKPAAAVALGNIYQLVTRASGCTPAVVPWASLQLAQLDGAEFSAVASGDFNGDGQPDLAISTNESLNLFTGNLGGTFSQGDLYAVSSPVTQISTARFPDGGGLLVAADLDHNEHLFALADNVPPDAGPGTAVSHLALLSSYADPTGGAQGSLLRGGELWVVGAAAGGDGGSLALTRVANAVNPTPGGVTVTPLPTFPAQATLTDFTQAMAPLPNRDDAAWLVMSSPGATNLLVALLTADPSTGGVRVATLPPQALGGGAAQASFEPEADGGLEIAVTSPTQSFTLLRVTEASNGTLTVSPKPVPLDPSFLPNCNQQTGMIVVAGSANAVVNGYFFDGGAPREADGGPLTCFNQGGAQAGLYVVDPSSGALEPVAEVSSNTRPQRCWTSPFVDGGEEIICVGTSDPGLIGLLPSAPGHWQGDPLYISSGQFVGVATYPTLDGSVAHVVSQVTPSTVQYLER